MSLAKDNLADSEISVIVPVYNREDTILACLNSIASQSLRPKEIILIDDGSTDSTKDVVDSWMQEHPDLAKFVRYFLQENRGKSAALNAGFEVATGKWIAFNDSDDLWLPHKLDTQLNILQANPSALICFSDSRFINDPSLTETNFQIRGFDKTLSGSCLLEKPFRTLADNPNGIFMQSILVHRDSARQVFPLAPDLRVGQDIDLIFRLSLTSNFCYTSEPLVEIDRTPSRSIGLTKQHDMKSLFRLQTKERIFQGWLDIDSNEIDQVRPLIRKHLSGVQRRIASHQKEQKNTTESRRYYKQAFENRKSVRNLLSWLFNHSLSHN